MTKPLSFKKQRELIKLALKREYPDVEFVLGTGTLEKGSDGWERYISVNYRDRGDLKEDDVKAFLERFTHDPVNDQGVAFLRTFWVNKEGHITIARIRAQYQDGTTSLVDKFAPPKPEGYTMERFPINKYEVNAKVGGYRYFDYHE